MLVANLEAFFQGYLIFARYNQYWSRVSNSWGFTVGPYALIGGFVVLISTWLIRTRVTQGLWTWQIKPLKKVDLTRGVAPKAIDPLQDNRPWRRALRRLLEAL
jgi:hypothetical protein